MRLLETKLPDVEVLNLGGGFKISRSEGDLITDIEDVSSKVL